MNRYYTLLRAKYPLADPASLIASFLILHEVTAIVPLFVGFYTLNSIGLGESIIQKISVTNSIETDDSWMAQKMKSWIQEGEEQGEKIGRRYGVLGYEKETKEERLLRKAGDSPVTISNVGGGVADLIAAYLLVKITMPLRMILSVRLAPVLANSLVGRLKGLRELGKKFIKKSKK